MSFKILPFTKKHLEDATGLFAVRYKEMRSKLTVLPNQYENQDVILHLLEGLVGSQPGVVALSGTRLVGFLVGHVFPSFRGRRSAYSPEWANVSETRHSQEIYQGMYEVLSSEWVADGCLNHIMTLLTDNCDATDAWCWAGFGMMAVDALRNLSSVKRRPLDITIRKAGSQDTDLVIQFCGKLDQHLTSAPMFLVRDEKHNKAYYEKLLSDPSCPNWLAYRGKEPIAYMGLGPANPSACHIIQDEKTTSVMGAFTVKRERQEGVATNLLSHAIEWAISAGYIRCAVDFESANTVSRRFWLHHFRPICYTLIRHIDEGVAKST